ncbi:hypothetical protein AB0D49_41525 [Streptomyces sp. NPDC048290]|uniref:hypothetical protein n=1 Tax=Streptomyces sp. NPDC048290 TaxID=3155811 RepID=UPI0034362B7C
MKGNQLPVGPVRFGGRSWTVAHRAGLALLVGLVSSACYVSTDYDRYPEGKLVPDAGLVRVWSGAGAELSLRADAAFSASALPLEYFECGSAGMRKKSGRGMWSTITGSGATSVLIRFEDGCEASLTAGRSEEDETVLWAGGSQDRDPLILR